jgi:hypothetical protein
MRLHRPQVTLNVLAGSLSEAEGQVWRFVGKNRLLSAVFHPGRNGGYEGTVTAIAVDLMPPPGAGWVESELWHPESTLTLHTVTDCVAVVAAVVAKFVDNRGHEIRDLEAQLFNSATDTRPAEYHSKATVRLSNPREEV